VNSFNYDHISEFQLSDDDLLISAGISSPMQVSSAYPFPPSLEILINPGPNVGDGRDDH